MGTAYLNSPYCHASKLNLVSASSGDNTEKDVCLLKFVQSIIVKTFLLLVVCAYS
jgi:hypothetical protein